MVRAVKAAPEHSGARGPRPSERVAPVNRIWSSDGVQIHSAASAAASAIAEAPTRSNTQEERECYARARRALVAVETQLAIARVSGIIPSSVHAQLAARVASLSQRVTNQVNATERPSNGRSPTVDLPLLADT